MILCSYGFSDELLEEKQGFLEEDPSRRLVFVDDKPPEIGHPQVECYTLQSPLQIYSIAEEVAKLAVLFPLEIIQTSQSPWFAEFQEVLIQRHRQMSLLLSDAADFGCQAIKNAKKNLSKPFYLLQDLRRAFASIPAILVGAGPSLEKEQEMLQSLKDKALIFAGGHGLEKIPFNPHFGVVCDKSPCDFSPQTREIPLFFQARAELVSSWNGKKILVPESHFSFLNQITNSGESFDSGWTVGNMMAQIAVYLGCNPIICIGMDYCFDGTKKYAFDEEESYQEQEDWEAAVLWMKDLEKKHPEIQFLNASKGTKYFSECSLSDLSFPVIPNIPEIVKTQEPICFNAWQKSLNNQEDHIYDSLLEPLWKLWEPIFSREHRGDKKALEIHKNLFFNQVLQEHLDAVR